MNSTQTNVVITLKYGMTCYVSRMVYYAEYVPNIKSVNSVFNAIYEGDFLFHLFNFLFHGVEYICTSSDYHDH